MYNSGMLRLIGYTVILILITTMLCLGASCGDSKKSPDSDNGSDLQVQIAIVEAIETDNQLDSDVAGMIQMIKTGQLDLQNGLDDMIDRSRALISLIDAVSGSETPSDPGLVEAREKMVEYLRNRVHQIEATLSVASVEELESVYSTEKAELEEGLQEIKDLMVEYNPELEKSLP